MRLQKGDEIIVTAGKDKGKKGTVEKLYPKNLRVLVPGINMYKKHLKARKRGDQGGIIDIVKPLPITNVALICPSCGKPTRVGISLKDDKKRMCRKCGKVIS